VHPQINTLYEANRRQGINPHTKPPTSNEFYDHGELHSLSLR
jgi:hypothetical protein